MHQEVLGKNKVHFLPVFGVQKINGGEIKEDQSPDLKKENFDIITGLREAKVQTWNETILTLGGHASIQSPDFLRKDFRTFRKLTWVHKGLGGGQGSKRMD